MNVNDIFTLINSAELGVYWNELSTQQPPYLGEGLFPSEQQVGLDMTWIKGSSHLPVRLRPAAFDTRLTLRDRGKLSLQKTEMPFFREGMVLNERDRQQLLSVQNSNASQALKDAIVQKIFNDTATLISGAVVVPEIERMQLLQTGTIGIASDIEQVNFEFDYDESGAWKASNFVTVAGVDLWTEPTSRKVRDLMAIKRSASAKGVTLTRGVVSPEVWLMLLEDPQINQEMFPQGGSNIVISDTALTQYLASKLGITFTVYDKRYSDGETDQAFMMPDRVVLLPASPVGKTYWGTTPEQADLMSGSQADVTIVNTGVAVSTKIEAGPPVQHTTWASEIVLPSFEAMDSVFVLKVV